MRTHHSAIPDSPLPLACGCAPRPLYGALRPQAEPGCRYALDCYAECCDGDYSLVSRHTRPRSDIHMSVASAFVRCQIDSLLCGFTASPVFAQGGRLTLFGTTCVTLRVDKKRRSNRKLCLFAWPKNKVSKAKGHPTSPSMAKDAIDVTRGFLPLGLKAAPSGVQNGYPAVFSSALRK